MSSYPGAGYLYSPLSSLWGSAYGGYSGNAITRDSTGDIDAAKPIKAADPLPRPWLQGAGQMPGYGLGPTSLNAYYMVAMRNYPLCNILQSKIALQVESGTRRYEIQDDGGDPELAEDIKQAANRALLPMLNKAIPGALEAPFYGNNLQELTWGKEFETKRIDVVKVRPVPFWQRIIHVDDYRQYTGYQMFGEYADARYGFLYVHKPQIDDVLGWSPNVAALNAFFRATKSAENADAIERKASGIQILMYMMQGIQFVDGNGTPVDQQKFITEMMNGAVRGESCLLPLMYFSKETVEQHPELAKVKLVEHDVIDWGNLGPMIEAHMGRQRDLHAQICWAWGISERSIMEADKGGIGTSDAGDHAESNILMAESWNSNICEQWDEQVTSRWMQTNFRDSGIILKATPAPMADPQQKFLQGITTQLVEDKDPETISHFDKRKLVERVEIPTVTEDEAKQKQIQQEKQQKEQANQQHQQMMESKGVHEPPTTGKPNDKPNSGKAA